MQGKWTWDLAGTVRGASGWFARLLATLASVLDAFARRSRSERGGGSADRGNEAQGSTTAQISTPPPLPKISRAMKVSVIIPALNEAARIASVVAYALADAATAEVIVIDDSSTDDTARLAQAAGARVVTSSMLGKGASMQDGMRAARHDLLVYLDGDLAGLRPGIISDLALSLHNDEADFVKAKFGRSGGRVTELTARPMLKLFFPELTRFAQPLGGIVAARKSLLQTFRFEDGYGVDIGLLIDAQRAGARLGEVDIGSLEHESQTLQGLSIMAQEVGRVIFDRAKAAGRLSVEHILSVYELDRQNQADIDFVLLRLRDRRKLALLDMDGTIVTTRFVAELARATGRSDKLVGLLDSAALSDAARSHAIAEVFRFVHKREFEEVARQMPIREGVVETVNRLRRAGYAVGVVSDSYFVAAEIVRRRIFADFCIAHTIGFESEVCLGKLTINRAFEHSPGCTQSGHDACKSNVLHHIRHAPLDVALESVVVVGDGLNDLCLLRMADRAYTIDPKHDSLRAEPGVIEIRSFLELAERLGVP
jgi:glucosyl-3-phosphoglycerate synthase